MRILAVLIGLCLMLAPAQMPQPNQKKIVLSPSPTFQQHKSPKDSQSIARARRRPLFLGVVVSILSECLDYVIRLSEKHLRTILSEWVAHYN